MRLRKRHTAIATAVLILLLTSPTVFGSKQNITDLKKTIQKEQQQQAKIKANLKQEDIAVHSLNLKLRKTNEKIKQQSKEVKKLSKETQSLSAAIHEQKQQIESYLVRTYKMKKAPLLRILTQQKNPNQTARNFRYIETLNLDNIETIQAMENSIVQLQKTETQMKSYQKALETTQKKQTKERKSLEQAKKQREKKLKAISASIASKQKKLEQLKKDNQGLEHVVAKVKPKPQKVDQIQFKPNSIPWPCHGKISQHFGEQIQHSELKTQGLVIAGDEGDPIYAIADGEVAFANWLSGFGLLIIIEHHNGYLSLYGRNDSLDVEVGDKITMGDTIAHMGKSGAFEKNGLYFAIRRADKAVDPETLLQK